MKSTTKSPEAQMNDYLSLFQKAYLAGDQLTMKKTFAHARREIVVFARTRTNSLNQAEELADKFIMKWIQYMQSDTPRNPRAFMCTSIRNQSINDGKQAKLHRDKQEQDIKPHLQRSHDPRQDTDEVISMQELSELTKETLALQKDKQRRIWELYTEGYSNGEIAQMLPEFGLNADRVSYHKNAIRQKLVEAINKYIKRISIDNIDYIKGILNEQEFALFKAIYINGKTLAEISRLSGRSVTANNEILSNVNRLLGLH